MKKSLLLVLTAILIGISVNVKAQMFLGEAFVGLNLCQVDGDEMMGFFKKGVNAGVGVLTPVFQKRNFSIELSLEVLYNQKGAKQDAKYDTIFDPVTHQPLTGEYNLRLHYGEVPLMVYFTDKKFVSAGVGVSYARLMGLKEYEHGYETGVSLNSGDYNRDEFNILADVKIRVWKRLKLGFRYSYSLNPIRTRSFTDLEGNVKGPYKQYNNMFTLRLTYVFNERLEDLKREEYHYQGDNPKFINKENERALKKMIRQQQRQEKKNGKSKQ